MPEPMNNRFLAALSPAAREQVLSASSFHDLPVGSPLFHADELARHCFLLTSGMASVIALTSEGHYAEVSVVGDDGPTGSSQLLGPAAMPAECSIQIAASGYKIRRDEMAHLFYSSEEIRTRILEFVQSRAFTVSYVSSCHRLHPAEARLARWLLMTQDRIHSPYLPLTQEFLGHALGVRRPTASTAVSHLRRRGAIATTHAQIIIKHEPRLRAAACGCYPMVEKLHRDLYKSPWRDGAYLSRKPCTVADR